MTNSKKIVMKSYEFVKDELKEKVQRNKELIRHNEQLETENRRLNQELTSLRKRFILPSPSETFLYRSKKIVQEQSSLISLQNNETYNVEQFLDLYQLENRLTSIQKKSLPRFCHNGLIVGKEIEYIDNKKINKKVEFNNIISDNYSNISGFNKIDNALQQFVTNSRLKTSILKMISKDMAESKKIERKPPVFTFDPNGPVHYREYMFKECQDLSYLDLTEFPSSEQLADKTHQFRIGDDINSPYVYLSPLKLFEVVTGPNAPSDLLNMVLKLRFLIFSVADVLHLLHLRLQINIPYNCVDCEAYEKEVVKPTRRGVATFLSKWLITEPKDFLEPDAEKYVFQLIKDFEENDFERMANLLRQVSNVDNHDADFVNTVINSTGFNSKASSVNSIDNKRKIVGSSLFSLEEDNESEASGVETTQMLLDDMDMDFDFGPSKKLVIDEINEHTLCEHLCMIDQNTWSNIPLREIVAYPVHNKRIDRLSPHVIEFLERSNAITNWVVTGVLTEFQFKRRKAIVSHFLKVATLLASNYNFYGAMAVYGGLSGYAVSKFKDVFSSLSTNKKNMEEKLKELCSFKDNSRFYRNLVSQVATSKQTFIPHIGLVLQDITFLHDGNQTMKNGCLNIFKLLKMTEILEGIFISKNQLKYDFRLNPELVSALTKNLVYFDDSVIKHLSLKISEA
eukprot:TRINITY_DN2619_c0_g1_i2.p1 TRINITY_DN2619_c0_g1~~TRINITY_DN2619_c0_g1_i2.p1  ORF type:complete len:681 (+),score=164.74 TRINITY_DN2619_c0_g1_i2:52-2094(+)